MYYLNFLLLFFSLLFGLSCINKSSELNTVYTHARIKTVHGDIVIKFVKPDSSDVTSHIKKLISENYYNGLSFHRVKSNAFIQTGKPRTGNINFRHRYHVELNDLAVGLGSVAIVRYTNDTNSADSQFFIVTGNHSFSNKHYTVFAHVTDGLEIAKKIQLHDKIITLTLE